MIVTEKQLLVLLQTTVDSLRVADGGQIFTFNDQSRRETANAVINQQDGTLTVEKGQPNA